MMMKTTMIQESNRASVLMILVSLVAPTLGHFHLTHISLGELTKRLATDNSLEPDQVFKLLDKCSAKDEMIFDGVDVADLLSLSKISKLGDCDDEVIEERLSVCAKVKSAAAPDADEGSYVSLRKYCNDRLTKLFGKCAKDINELGKELILGVKSHDLGILRLLMKKFWDKPDDEFKVAIDEYMTHHEYDFPIERKRADVGNSCESLTMQLAPLRVIEDNAGDYGVQVSMNDTYKKWMKAIRMCEFYLANY